MTPTALVGLDVGTTGVKAVAISPDGSVVAVAEEGYGLSSPRPGWSEQDPRDWWAATCKATKAVLKKAKVKPSDIGGIGLSGQMHGSVFLADGEKPLRPALLWNDQRTAQQCAEIEAKAGGRERLIDMVANPALTGFTAPKILWVRDHEPRVYAKTKHILLPKDYIRLCMTGEYATEVSDASGTLLLDVADRAWSNELLSILDIDKAFAAFRSRLLEAVRHHDREFLLGTLDPDVQTGYAHAAALLDPVLGSAAPDSATWFPDEGRWRTGNSPSAGGVGFVMLTSIGSISPRQPIAAAPLTTAPARRG